MLTLTGLKCCLRPWQMSDAPSMALYANNRQIWRNLRDQFPFPFTVADAERWIDSRLGDTSDGVYLAIDVDGAAAGGIACRFAADVESRSAELGYWLGEPFWGSGVATEAVRLITAHVFDDLDIVRLQACIFGWNRASGRVLEKNGFQLEGVLRSAVFKDNDITDKLIYGRLHPAMDTGSGPYESLKHIAATGVVAS